jgi:hypothetical protein
MTTNAWLIPQIKLANQPIPLSPHEGIPTNEAARLPPDQYMATQSNREPHGDWRALSDRAAQLKD